MLLHPGLESTIFMGRLKKFTSVVLVAVLCIGIVNGSSTVIEVHIMEGNDGESMNITLGSSPTLPAHLNDDDTDSIVDSADSSEASLHESSIESDDEDVKANKSKRQQGAELRAQRPLRKVEKGKSKDTMKRAKCEPSSRVALGYKRSDRASPVAVQSSTMTESSDGFIVDIEESDSDDSVDLVSRPIDLNADIFLVVLSCISVPARAVALIEKLRLVNRKLNVIMEEVITRLDDSVVGDFRAKLQLRRLLVTSRFRSRSWTPRDVAWYKQLCTHNRIRKSLSNIVATAKRPLFYTSSIPLGDLYWYDTQFRLSIAAIVMSMVWGFFDFIWISMLMSNPDNPFSYLFMALISIGHLLILDCTLFGFTFRGLIKCGLAKGDPNKTYDSIADFYESDGF